MLNAVNRKDAILSSPIMKHLIETPLDVLEPYRWHANFPKLYPTKICRRAVNILPYYHTYTLRLQRGQEAW